MKQVIREKLTVQESGLGWNDSKLSLILFLQEFHTCKWRAKERKKKNSNSSDPPLHETLFFSSKAASLRTHLT